MLFVRTGTPPLKKSSAFVVNISLEKVVTLIVVESEGGIAFLNLPQLCLSV